MSVPAKATTSWCTNGDLMYYIHSCICIAIMFGFGFLAPVEPLTVMGMKIIGIFLGLLYGWMFVGLIWPSLIGLLALPLCGYMTAKQMLAVSFGDNVVMMMFFIFIFSAIIEECGLSRFISLWFITRKSVMGKPWLFSFVFLGSVYLLGALTSSSPAIIIGWSILYGICGELGFKKGDKYPIMMVFGIVFAAQMGMSLMPFKQVPLVSLGAYEKMAGTTIDYLTYMLISGVVGILSMVILVFIGKYIFKPDVEPLRKMNLQVFDVKSGLVLNKIQKVVMFFLLLLIFLLIVPSVLPKTMWISKILSTISGTGVVILLVSIMCFLKVDGKPLMNFKKAENTGVTWGIVLLLAAVQPVTEALTSKATGFNPFVISILDPVFGGTSALFFLLFMGVVSILLTNFCNNGAVAVALMPIAYTYSQAMGLHPGIIAIIITMCVHIAFMTPAASASSALLHGNNEWISTKSILKIGSYMLVVSYVLIIGISLILGKLMFNY